MSISRRMAAGKVTGFLLSTSVPAVAGSHDLQGHQTAINDVAIPCERSINGATIPCQPLSWDAANKLPWFIKASEVECMSPTLGDLQASAQARNLVETAIFHMQEHRPMSGSSTLATVAP